MYDFFRRSSPFGSMTKYVLPQWRKRQVLVSAAVGVAGAAAAYYCLWHMSEWISRDCSHCEQSIILEHEVFSAAWQSALCHKSKWRAPEAALNEQESVGEEFPLCGQHAAQRDFRNKGSGRGQRSDEEEEAEEGGEELGSIDASMNAHFDSIQDSFVPAEVLQLMSRLQARLAEMTDVATHMQLLPPSADTQEKLRLVVRLCLTHAFGSIWLLSIVEAFTQVKLNIIGRHLFLQEKLAKLAPPAPPPPSWPYSLSPQQHQHQSQPLPPQLDPRAVEAFLACDSFSTHGCQWLLFKVMSGVEVTLRQVSVATEVGSPELRGLLDSMLVAIHKCIGPAVNWADVLVGTDAMTQASKLHLEATTSGMDPHQAMQAAASVEELHAELRDALCSRKFSGALHACIQHTFHAFAAQLSASLTPPFLPPPPSATQSSIPRAYVDQSNPPAPAPGHYFGGELHPVTPSAVQTRTEQGSTCFTGGESMGVTPQGGPIQMQPLENAGAASSAQGWSPSPGGTTTQQTAALPQQQQQLQHGAGGIDGVAAQQSAALKQQQQQLQSGPTGTGGAHRPEACLPRMPLARSGKQIRSTADFLLADVGPLSKELSSLQPLRALAASIFAAPSRFAA